MLKLYKLRLSAVMAVMFTLYSITAAASEYTSSDEFPADVITALVPFATYGLVRYKKEDRKGESQFLRSTGVTLFVNSALRLGFNQTSWGERPNGSPYGFPSGHASFMVSNAAFLQDRYGWQYGLPAYLLSGYVSWVRVDTGHHRWRDIVAGAAVGYTVSKLYVTPQDAPNITPIIGPDSVGLRWERSF